MVVIYVLGVIAIAIDTARLATPRPSWKIIFVAWAALIVGHKLVTEQITLYHKTHYAQTFTIPSGAMMPPLPAGDYIMVETTGRAVPSAAP